MEDLRDYKTVLVIGNGFDKDAGLPSAYKEYMGSSYFQNIKNSNLAMYLQNCLKSQERWIDIEMELFKYSYSMFFHQTNGKMSPLSHDKNNLIESLRGEYLELCNSLKSYLKEISNKGLLQLKEKNSLRLLSEELKEDQKTYVLTFNYTNTLENIAEKYFCKRKMFINHIHGSLETEIIFGVEDSADISKEHVFLYKSYRNHENVRGLPFIFDNAERFVFFGYSLGQTDHSYFDDFFKSQTMSGCQRKEFIFYYYGQTAYDDLIWQLKKLTGNRLSYFSKYNMVSFEDSSK